MDALARLRRFIVKRLILFCTLILIATTGLAKQDKILICHVGNEVGPGGEVYLDDPGCVPIEENDYFCPDAGKIDLISVAKVSKHLGNPSHEYDGISDYRPADIGASGDGKEDSNGDGIDDGCQPPETCPCWDEVELLSVTAENQADFSCLYHPTNSLIQNDDVVFPTVEGGFLTRSNIPDCLTRDFPFSMVITVDELVVCNAQIAARCAAIGRPIIIPE